MHPESHPVDPSRAQRAEEPRRRAHATLRRFLAVAAGCGLASCASSPPAPTPSAKPVGVADDIAVLASPEMEGRGAGTEGQAKASEYLVGRFTQIGLVPIMSGGKGYLERFEQPSEAEIDPATQLLVDKKTLRLGADYWVLPFSGDGTAELPLVFAGYGVTAPELHYDDYTGLDVKDKAVLVFDHEPRERDEKSPFRAPEAFRYRKHEYKAINAREHGARAVLIACDGLHHPELPDESPRGRLDDPSAVGIPAFSVSEASASSLLHSEARTAEHVIDESLSPQSRKLDTRIDVNVHMLHHNTEAMNVVGSVPGTDPKLRSEAIVVGAHYDHLGYGGWTSLAPDQKAIHPGADDNASGVSAILRIAEHFKAKPLRRTLVFAAFAGEELLVGTSGLFGSSEYVKHPPIPLANTVAMMNLDMVGRLREKVIVQGVGTSPGFDALVRKKAESQGLALKVGSEGIGPSDHTSFYMHDVPVLFFFTGSHDDYHRPSDTADKINVPGIETVASFVEAVVEGIDADDARPQLIPAQKQSTPPGGGGRGYGAYLGTIPDFAGESPSPGVLLGGVKAGSPAEKAGLQKGDILVRIGTTEVHNLQDMTFALREHRSGDTVDIVVVRGGQNLTVKATLGDRR